MMNKKELENKLEDLKKQYEDKRKEITTIQQKILKTLNDIYELDDDYTKIVCPVCNGNGMERNKEGKLKKCKNCDSKGWLWVKRWREK